MIITENPSKAYMELMNWHLNYRDKKHLLRLAEEYERWAKEIDEEMDKQENEINNKSEDD